MIRPLCAILLAACAIAGDVAISSVDYQHEGLSLRGTLALPVGAKGSVPGVLVVPEWWGRNDYTERRARELAEQGYAAFAIDMYGTGKVTQDPQQAGAWATPLIQDRVLMVARARAGLIQLRNSAGVDPGRIAAIGFCFGGTVVLELARAGEQLKAVACFHGGLKTPTKVVPGAITAKILVLNGGSDPMVPPEDVAGFMTEMAAAKADWRLEIFGSAKHAFTNPGADAYKDKLPIAYDPDAERRSFAALRDLLVTTLK